jgi:hypothetical protein
MFVLQLQESGANGLLQALDRAQQEFSDWSKELEKLAPESTAIVHSDFDAEFPGSPSLNPAYEARKAKEFPGKTKLRRTDAFYLSFDKDQPGNITRISPLSGEYGSDVFYGAFHQDRFHVINITDAREDKLMMIAVTSKNERLIDLGFQLQ